MSEEEILKKTNESLEETPFVAVKDQDGKYKVVDPATGEVQYEANTAFSLYLRVLHALDLAANPRL